MLLNKSVTQKPRAAVGEAHKKLEHDNKMWRVYLLRCNDGKIYTGCTNNLDDRLKRHMKGEIDYTSKRLPIELITYIAFTDKYKAYEFEKYLKSGSGKAFSNKRFL